MVFFHMKFVMSIKEADLLGEIEAIFVEVVFLSIRIKTRVPRFSYHLENLRDKFLNVFVNVFACGVQYALVYKVLGEHATFGTDSAYRLHECVYSILRDLVQQAFDDYNRRYSSAEVRVFQHILQFGIGQIGSQLLNVSCAQLQFGHHIFLVLDHFWHINLLEFGVWIVFVESLCTRVLSCSQNYHLLYS